MNLIPRNWGTARLSDRWIAFLIHFSGSVVLIGTIFAIIYLLWFPYALARASGGLEGLLILLTVDIVLGPVLTAIVFDTSKSWGVLSRDIGVIVTLQIAALGGGILVLQQARPLVVVHAHDTFYVLRNQDFAVLNIDWSILRSIPGDYPKVVYVQSEHNQIAFEVQQTLDQLNRLRPLYLRLDKYQLLPQDRHQVTSILRLPKDQAATGCIRQNIVSAFTSGSVCFDPETQRFSDFIPNDNVIYQPDVGNSKHPPPAAPGTNPLHPTPPTGRGNNKSPLSS